MHIVRQENLPDPQPSPSGEIVFELIGASEAGGGTERHSVALIRIPPGNSSDRHYHVLSEETFYVLKGIARMVIDGTAFQLTAGHACLIEPTEEHQIFNIGEGDLAFIAVCVPAWVLDDSVFV